MNLFYAVNESGRPIVQLLPKPGAGKTDCETFVRAGGVKGAVRVAEGPPLAEESERRIDAALRAMDGRPAPTHDATLRPAPGSLEDSAARTKAALSGWGGGSPAAPSARSDTPLTSLPVVMVEKQVPRTGLQVPQSEFRTQLNEVKATLDGLKAKLGAKSQRSGGPGAPVELREVPQVDPPNLEESDKRIAAALAAF